MPAPGLGWPTPHLEESKSPKKRHKGTMDLRTTATINDTCLQKQQQKTSRIQLGHYRHQRPLCAMTDRTVTLVVSSCFSEYNCLLNGWPC